MPVLMGIKRGDHDAFLAARRVFNHQLKRAVVRMGQAGDQKKQNENCSHTGGSVESVRA